MRAPLVAALPLLGLACGPAGADPRIATPEATVRTVLEATHLVDAPPVLPVGRFGREPAPERPPPDLAALALCFWDFDRDDLASRGMADFVAGMLAAMEGRLVYHVGRRRSTVDTGFRTVVMRRSRSGRSRSGWHIVLAESVPPEIQEGLRRRPRSALDDRRGRDLP